MFDPRALLSIAERCLVDAADEAAQRSAINRSYYAAFLVTREYVQQQGIVARPPAGSRWGSHERVIFSIGVMRHPSARHVRKALFRLKKLRTSADYDLRYADARTDVMKAMQDAAMIIAWIDALP